MPLSDRRLRPDLAWSPPGDSPPGCGDDDEYRAGREVWRCRFRDGQDHEVTAIAWWRDTSGRQVVHLEWHAEHSTWTDTYLFDPEKMRR